MKTNFEITKNEKIEKTKNCPCIFCTSGVEQSEADNKLFVDFLDSWHDINDHDMYYTQIDHCHQEMGLGEMYFHNSWNWILKVVRKCFSINEDTPDFFGGDWDFEGILYGDFKKVYDECLKFIKNYNYEVSKYTTLAYDFFRIINEDYNTYSLSDCVEEIFDDPNCDDANTLIRRRNELQIECKRLGIDFHRISCEVGEDFLAESVLPKELKNKVKSIATHEEFTEITVADSPHDMTIYIVYSDDEIEGLNFMMDSDNDHIFEEVNIHLTEIYNRLKARGETFSGQTQEYGLIHKAIDLYCMAFIFQDDKYEFTDAINNIVSALTIYEEESINDTITNYLEDNSIPHTNNDKELIRKGILQAILKK
jgi:hypothetical protein